MSALAQSTSSHSTPKVVTVLDPFERPRVEAAGLGVYRAVHRDTLADALHDLRAARADAVILSLSRTAREAPGHLARVVREFPTVPTVAILTRDEPAAPVAAMALGRHGVRTLIDVRGPAGWRELRDHLAGERLRDLDRHALGRLREDLGDATPDCWRFFEGIFDGRARLATVLDLGRRLGVCASTLNSRFFRLRLPAPKRYLAWARLIRAAHMLENPGVSLATCADRLEYSSPQSFGRHIRTLLGVTAGDFRATTTGEAMLERYRRELVRPHRDRLATLRPLTSASAP